MIIQIISSFIVLLLDHQQEKKLYSYSFAVGDKHF